jgi:hypothetical protein
MAGGASSRVTEAAEPAASVRAGDVIQVGNMRVQIARWYDGKKSAVSVLFQGSDPSLLTTGIPMINRYGRLPFVGTFFPGRLSDSYRAHRQEWETAIREGGHDAPEGDTLLPGPLTVGSDPTKVDIVGLDMFKQRVDAGIATEGWALYSFRAIGPDGGLSVAETDFQQMMYYLSMRRYYWEAWIGGVSQVQKYQQERDAARISAEAISPTKIKMELTCGTDARFFDQPLTIQVDFEYLWRDYNYDVEVLDSNGQQIPVLRKSDLGSPLLIHVPPVKATYYVQVTDPRKNDPPALDDAARTVRDPASGLTAALCKWYDGRRAAVSFRFDDSYPSNINKAVPWLREYGLKGTFMINPGNSDYQNHRAAWEACAAQGDQEFGNHSMHHHGALDDAEVEREVGEACEVIWNLFPRKSKLMAFIAGGGTVWSYSRPFRYYVDKYHLFAPHPEASMGVTNSDADNYRGRLAQAIERGAWFASSYHAISLPWMSDETFRAVLESTRERQADIWPAGLAEAHKYREERNSSALTMRSGPEGALTLAVTCGTNRELFDQPLTIELALPDGWSAQTLRVRDAAGAEIATRTGTGAPRSVTVFTSGGGGGTIGTRRETEAGPPVVRFDVPPANAEYTISK